MNSINQINKYALITGASSGLGKAISLQLAGMGYNVIIVGNDNIGLVKLKKLIITKFLIKVYNVCIDLSNPKAIDNLFNICDKKKFVVSVLINCAGIFKNINDELYNENSIDGIINLHVNTLTKLCLKFGTEMRKRRFGYILNISSIAANFIDPASLTYGPTKRFIKSFSEGLHCELKPYNVYVSCAMPGGINTEFFSSNIIYIPYVIRKTLISADKCATICLKKLFKGRRLFIPGIFGKIQYFVLRMISRPATYGLIKKLYFYMKNKNI
jgi:hypothetical protein